MYEQWRLSRWETPLSDAKHLFMESLHDHSGKLEIEFADYSDNNAIARYYGRSVNTQLTRLRLAGP